MKSSFHKSFLSATLLKDGSSALVSNEATGDALSAVDGFSSSHGAHMV